MNTPSDEHFLTVSTHLFAAVHFQHSQKKTALRFASLGGNAGSIGAAGLGRLTWKQQNSQTHALKYSSSHGKIS